MGQVGGCVGGWRRGRVPAPGAAVLSRPGNLHSYFMFREQRESQLRSTRPDTAALRYCGSRSMLKPHELHIVLLVVYEFWQRRGRHFYGVKTFNMEFTFTLIRASLGPLGQIRQSLINVVKYLVVLR